MSGLVGDLADFERTKFLLDESIRIGRKRLHDEFVLQNRGLLRFLDVLFILLVLTNHAALFATNYLLIKHALILFHNLLLPRVLRGLVTLS